MRFFILTVVFLFHVLGSLSLEAFTVADVDAQAEFKSHHSASLSPVSIRANTHAEHVSTTQFSLLSSKVNDQRTPGSAVPAPLTIQFSVYNDNESSAISAFPSGTPLTRLILFPKHYFW